MILLLCCNFPGNVVYNIVALGMMATVSGIKTFGAERLVFFRESARGLDRLAYFWALETWDHAGGFGSQQVAADDGGPLCCKSAAISLFCMCASRNNQCHMHTDCMRLCLCSTYKTMLASESATVTSAATQLATVPAAARRHIAALCGVHHHVLLVCAAARRHVADVFRDSGHLLLLYGHCILSEPGMSG